MFSSNLTLRMRNELILKEMIIYTPITSKIVVYNYLRVLNKIRKNLKSFYKSSNRLFSVLEGLIKFKDFSYYHIV